MCSIIVVSMATLNIQKIYIKNPEIQQDVVLLTKWVEKQKDLPKSSELLLFLCLHSCFYNIDKTKEKIKSFYNLRKSWPAVFKNRNPSVYPFRTQFNLSVVWPLNCTTPEGYKIIFVRIIDSDATAYDLEGQLKLVFVVMDYWSRIKGDSGFVTLIDHDCFTWSHLPKYRIGIIKKYIAYTQEALPMAIRQVHFIHLSSLTQTLFKISQMFLKKETRELLHYHHNTESLYNYIPQRCLPRDLGGDDVSIAELHEDMIETVLAHSDLFTNEDEGSSGLYG